MHINGHRIRVNTGEPTPQPVIGLILDDIQNGGEVMVRAMVWSAMPGTFHAGPIDKTLLVWPGGYPDFNSDADFLRMIAATSRSGGVTPSLWLMRRCARTETAWLGGIERPEKKPGEWPERRLSATILIQSATGSGIRAIKGCPLMDPQPEGFEFFESFGVVKSKQVFA